MLQEPYQIPARLFQVINCISLIWGAHEVLHDIPGEEVESPDTVPRFDFESFVVTRMIDLVFCHGLPHLKVVSRVDLLHKRDQLINGGCDIRPDRDTSLHVLAQGVL